jgi:hypothetical protein
MRAVSASPLLFTNAAAGPARFARRRAPPPRPTQQRAGAPSGAPGLLLCQEAGVSPCAPGRRRGCRISPRRRPVVVDLSNHGGGAHIDSASGRVDRRRIRDHVVALSNALDLCDSVRGRRRPPVRNENPNSGTRSPPQGIALLAEGADSASTRDRRGTVVRAFCHAVTPIHRTASVHAERLVGVERDAY